MDRSAWFRCDVHGTSEEEELIRICPSILNADHSRLQSEIERIANAADILHLDVMDNIFVPNRTFSLEESERIISESPLPVDCHLMIANPDEAAISYARAGSASVTFHLEASKSPAETLKAIRGVGVRAALAIKPGTPFEAIEPLLDEIDMLLIMTVEPGFGGQKFMMETLPKIRQAHEAISALTGVKPWLQVDGGISMETIALAAAAGADAFVAGSALFKADSPAAMCQQLRELAELSQVK